MDENVPLLSVDSTEDTELKRVEGEPEVLENEEVSSVCNLPAGKKYHLFISCSTKDNQSIKAILEKLENDYKIKCVNPDIDFIPGKYVLQNIHELMVESMKILIVMSSNYFESSFCNYEKRLAFFIHAGEQRHCLIPLLIESCHNIPIELKQLTYIDAETEKNIPARIVDALRNNDSPNCLVPDKIPEEVLSLLLGKDVVTSSRSQNGFPLFFMHAIKETQTTLGNQWKFKQLTKSEVENMEKENIKIGKFYVKLIADLNSQSSLRHFGALVGVPQLMAMILIAIPFGIAAAVTMSLTSILLSGVYSDPSITILILSIFFVMVMCGLVVLGRKLMYYLIAGRVHSCIWKHMKSYYKTGKFLIFYQANNTKEPTLELIRYDTEPCKNYLMEVLSTKYPLRSTEELESTADRLIESKIQVERKRLNTWSSLPSCIVERHNTYQRKKCLCELIEDTNFKNEETSTVIF